MGDSVPFCANQVEEKCKFITNYFNLIYDLIIKQVLNSIAADIPSIVLNKLSILH